MGSVVSSDGEKCIETKTFGANFRFQVAYYDTPDENRRVD